MPKYVAAVDQGTTSTRFMVFDHSGKVVARRPERTRADLPQARLGRAQPAGNLGSAPRKSSGRLAKAG